MSQAASEEGTVFASRRLVIDASIAHAAGDEKTLNSPDLGTIIVVPNNCRDVLNAVRRVGFVMVLTSEIVREWNEHQSRFSLAWRIAMTQASKTEVVSHSDEKLRNDLMEMAERKVGQSKITEDVCRIMLKDCHLLEAALAADGIVLALDDKVRHHFRIVAEVIAEIREVVWVNPDKAEEEAIAWLEAGAGPELHRQLGFRQNST